MFFDFLKLKNLPFILTHVPELRLSERRKPLAQSPTVRFKVHGLLKTKTTQNNTKSQLRHHNLEQHKSTTTLCQYIQQHTHSLRLLSLSSSR